MLLPYKTAGCVEAGCDEAGRGCLAGAVYAAAVILPPDFRNEVLNDSKQLTEKQRYDLRPVIEKEAVAWAVGIVSPEEIDRINILKASFLAMHRAIDALAVRPEALLIDGNRFTPYAGIPHSCEVKGDGRFLSIAAASVLAKTYRDDYMLRLHEVERKQRLPHPRPPRRHTAVRGYALPPADIPPARRFASTLSFRLKKVHTQSGLPTQEWAALFTLLYRNNYFVADSSFFIIEKIKSAERRQSDMSSSQMPHNGNLSQRSPGIETR